MKVSLVVVYIMYNIYIYIYIYIHMHTYIYSILLCYSIITSSNYTIINNIEYIHNI